MNIQDKALSVVKVFGMANLMAEQELETVESNFKIRLRSKSNSKAKSEDIYFPQFDEEVRAQASAMSKYYEVFYCLERTARDIIREKMRDKEGANWWEKAGIVTDQVKQEVAKRIRTETESGFTARSSDPLDYTTFGELGEIVKTNWVTFSDFFNDQRATINVMNRLNLLRGPIAHSCPLVEDEVIRFQLTLRDWFRLMD